MRRGGFLRYLIYYTCARCLFQAGRSAMRGQRSQPDCPHGYSPAYIAIALLGWFIIGMVVASAIR